MRRNIARLAAVQVMYQIDMTGSDPDRIVSNFENYYMTENDQYNEIDEEFFKYLTDKFKENINIGDIVRSNLKENGKIERIPSIALSIIKVGIIETIFEKSEIRVIINEYVEIAKNFVDRNGVRFVNAILDKVAKQVREH
jgi:N utilization substance protein B